MIACYNGHRDVVEYLLVSGVDVNSQRTDGKTALHGCAEAGHLEVVKLLLEHKASFQEDLLGEC